MGRWRQIASRHEKWPDRQRSCVQGKSLLLATALLAAILIVPQSANADMTPEARGVAKKIETLRAQRAEIASDWNKRATDINRTAEALQRVIALRATTHTRINAATDVDTLEALKRRLSAQRKEIDDLQKRFDKGHATLAKLTARDDALSHQRAALFKEFRAVVAHPSSDDEVPEDAPLDTDDRYSVFGGSFEDCLTHDQNVIALYRRTDSSKPLTNDPKQKMTTTDNMFVPFPYTQSYACPNLSHGHKLSAAQVCSIVSQGTSTRIGWIRGGLYCLYETGKGGFAPPPQTACALHGAKALGLSSAETSTFARWDGPTHNAVCFYFPKSLVADLLPSRDNTENSRALAQLEGEAVKLETEAKTATKAAAALEQAYRDLHDGMSIDASIEAAVQRMTAASNDAATWQTAVDRAQRALDIWAEARAKIAAMPLDATSANSATASYLLGEVASRAHDFRWFTAEAKYANPLGALLSALAVPAERTLKERDRDDFLGQVDDEMQIWQAVHAQSADNVAEANRRYRTAHSDREAAKDFAAAHDEELVRASTATRRAEALRQKAHELRDEK